MIRVAIRARSPAARAALAHSIREHPTTKLIEVIDEQRPAAESRAADEGSEPDVIVAELDRRSNADAFDLLEEASSGVPVILLVRGPAADWGDTLRQGVRGVLESHSSPAQIVAAIEAVAAGLAVLGPAELTGFTAPQRTPNAAEELPQPLTAREIEVLRAMAEGLANKEIAARLGISEHTVKFHVASILGKLGAASRTEAVTLGIRRGIVLI